MNRVLTASIASLLVLTACSSDTASTPNGTGNSPGTSIDGRVAPDANGNNRDQPLQTTVSAP